VLRQPHPRRRNPRDKLFLAGLDAKMIALDAKTGKELWNVDVADYKQQYAMTVAPLVVKDKVISGVAGGEHGVRGFLAAFDVNTGKEVWRFYTVPGPGSRIRNLARQGRQTQRLLPAWRSPHLGTGSYDPATNLTMWGTGNAGPDYNGDNRVGDNLYSSSVIAVDADTGKLKWHYQFSPHDEFDWDATQVPVLADVEFNGSPRKVMMLANRNGVFYVLDRTNGQFLSGTSFVKTNWLAGFDEKGRPARAPESCPQCKGPWCTPATKVERIGTTLVQSGYGLVLYPSWENSSSVYRKGEDPPEFHDGQSFTGQGPGRGGATDDVFSSIIAMDPKTRQRKWTFRMSLRPPKAACSPPLRMCCSPAAGDGQFIAIDARDGKLLWETNLGPSVSAAP